MNLHVCATFNCNTAGRSAREWGNLARAQSGTNLVEQLPEASRVAGRAAEAGVGVNLRELADGGSEIRRIHCGGEFERRLGFHSQEAAPRQDSEQFAVKPRRKLRIALRRSRAPQLKEQTDPADQFRDQIESQRNKKRHKKNRQQETRCAMPELPGSHPPSTGSLFFREPVARRI